MASALAVVPMVTGFPQVTSRAPLHPVKSHSRQIGFVKTSPAGLQAAGRASSSASNPINTARVAAVTPVQDVAGPVTVVGVTWATGASPVRDTYQIRTLTGTTWSQWESLVVIDGGPGAGPAATTGTDPYIITGASKYEVRSLTTGSTGATTATVQAIDPGTSSADDVQQAPGAAAAATAKPAIHTRAQWGADESKMTWDPSYGKVSLGFVHHTAGTNDYTQAQVPGIIRGIYQFHAVQMGWGDIGYNFLVDRFGGIWEGRYGGMDKPVIGGQVYNYNAVSTGVSGLGDFTSAAVPQAMTDAFTRVLAWRLSVAGIPATGNSSVLAPNGTPIQRIAGHRDAGGSACPGNSLYAKLPGIRAGAAALMSAVTSNPSSNPFGQFDSASAPPLSVSASGWAIDPDTTSPILVQMYVDGLANALTWANRPRPDVGRAYPSSGPNHGYTLTMAATPGTHTVCLYAINTGPGASIGLGCRAVTVTASSNPFGQFDSASALPLSVSASGWAIDPDTTSPIMVQMYVDGLANALTWANRPRPDVGRAYPSSGPNHGYTLTMAATPGTHTVCLYAINTGPGASIGLGCRAVTVSSNPFGMIESVSTANGKVSASGWAMDPDTTSPIMVQMYVDGLANALTWANRPTPDVGRAYPSSGPNHGYTLTMAATPGTHTVCLYAINTGPGASIGLGCRAVTASSNPFGMIESVSTANGKVSASGWALDPDSTSPIMVQMYVDGLANALTWANRPRPDVGSAYPLAGPNHGYTLTMAATPGTHTVCLYAINTGPGASIGFGCRFIKVP